MNHEMKLKGRPFEAIRTKQKSIELRLNDEKRQLVKINDTITFTNLETGEKMIVSVLGLCHFVDFAALVKVVGSEACGGEVSDTPEDWEVGMETYYPRSEIDKYGVLGIAVQPV